MNLKKSDQIKIEKLTNILGVDIGSIKKGSGKTILISGGSCAGKSSMSNMLSSKYPDFTTFNSGDIFRDEAKKLGVQLSDFMKSADNATEDLLNLDKAVDCRTIRQLIESDDNLLITSRLGPVWGIILDLMDKPYISIYLVVAKDEEIRRFIKREFKKTPSDLTQSEKKLIDTELKRDSNDQSRYKMLYGSTPSDFISYTTLIDTTDLNIKQVEEKVRSLVDNFLFSHSE